MRGAERLIRSGRRPVVAVECARFDAAARVLDRSISRRSACCRRAPAGNVANISTYDVLQSNGVIHVIDRVAMPR